MQSPLYMAQEMGKELGPSEILQRCLQTKKIKMSNTKKTLRLVIGDQLNSQHSWYQTIDANTTYVIMELKSETDYALHHVQKVLGFFAAMRAFAEHLQTLGHKVIYIKLNDAHNLQSFDKNCEALIAQHGFNHFEYQLPDEYRLDELLKTFTGQLKIAHAVFDTEHFYSERTELKDLFAGKKLLLMETFYRHMRKKHRVLIEGDNQPLNGQWNFDADNRQKLPKAHQPIAPLLFDNDLSAIENELKTNKNENVF